MAALDTHSSSTAATSSSASSPTARPPERPETREDRLVTFYARAWSFFDQNKALVYGALAGLVLLVLALIGYLYYQSVQAEEAETRLGQIVGVYERGEYEAALEGTGDRMGLLAIASEYGSTPSGNLARFYAAGALYELGEYDRALEHFQAFDKEENLLGASALAGEAAIYANREDFAEAAAHYEEAAALLDSEATAPGYLLSAGRAYEEAGNYAAAVAAYEAVGERYAASAEAEEAARYLARARARQN